MRVGHCVRSAFHGIPGGKNGPARAVARGILAQPESAVPTQRLRKGGGGGDTGGRALSCGLISRLSPKGPASSRHPLPRPLPEPWAPLQGRGPAVLFCPHRRPCGSH